MEAVFFTQSDDCRNSSEVSASIKFDGKFVFSTPSIMLDLDEIQSHLDQACDENEGTSNSNECDYGTMVVAIGNKNK